MPKYEHKKIEQKWQAIWDQNEIYKTDMNDKTKPKYYTLEMFAYPSGSLHVGHLRNYTIGDAINRYKKMKGFNVFHPFGWDSFGLPAENAAIDNGIHPAVWTAKNIESMKAQLKPIGFSYDFSHELETYKPSYYKWTQKIFNEMFKKGLVYKKTSYVNWCPECNTVLANEQVINGKCWRHSKTDVIQKELSQWYFKITAYAEELLNDLDKLKGHWPNEVLLMQKNWIGKSQGARVIFEMNDVQIPVFTTRIDTIFGVSAILLAPEHEIVKSLNLSNDKKEIISKMINEDKIDRTNDDKEKYGVDTGYFAINPINNKKIPVHIANYILPDYGTGAVMAVPCHDERDREYANKYNLEMIEVVKDDKLINSGQFNGLNIENAKKEILSFLEEKKVANLEINYKLHDWLISRQRYWGTPIPALYDKNGTISVDSDLPVLLPLDVEFSGNGNPLETSKEFKTVLKNGVEYTRETDTMDTFVDSSWYFLRYLDVLNDKEAINKDLANHFMNVDTYIGGIEHAVLHLLYARFIYKVLRDLGYVKSDEPFKELITQGMVLSQSYQRPSNNKYLFKSEVYEKDGNYYAKDDNELLIVKVEKMSKSKNNGVKPQEIIEEYGADATRLFALFAAPTEKELEWKDTGVMGAYRFLNRFYLLVSDTLDHVKDIAGEVNILKRNKQDVVLHRKLHQTIQKVTESLEDNFHFNTAIASIMELLNEMSSYKNEVIDKNNMSSESQKIWRDVVENTTLLLSPFVPHIADEIYEMIGHQGFVYNQEWPTYIDDLTKEDSIKIPVQVNGKMRALLEVDINVTEEDITKLAFENKNVQKHFEGKEVVKKIYVPKKLINIVIK